MARQNAFVVTGFAEAEKAAERFDSLTDRALLRLRAVDVVNEVAVRFKGEAARGMNADLNLSDDYIASRLRLIQATAGGSGKVRAEIVARGDLTILGHYPNAQLTQPARGRARGDAKRGIAPGRKQAGVAVEIKRGQASDQPKWFTMTLRRGLLAGEKVGVFVRTSAGPLKHIYGPSPYSLFRHQIEVLHDDLEADLQRTATARMADAIERTIT